MEQIIVYYKVRMRPASPSIAYSCSCRTDLFDVKFVRDCYIDNVILQVVEHHLLTGLDEEFSPDWIRDADLFDRVTRDPKHDQ
jgi:hypothetical protein